MEKLLCKNEIKIKCKRKVKVKKMKERGKDKE